MTYRVGVSRRGLDEDGSPVRRRISKPNAMDEQKFKCSNQIE